MKIIADVSIVPLGVEASVSKYVKAAYQTLVTSSLNARLCPNGTVIEGEYDEVVKAIKDAMEAVHAAGAPRITMSIRTDTRFDKETTAQQKLDAVLGR